MRGKTVCLVTGATNGIGYETALGLARRGARVALVGRDAGKTQACAAQDPRGRRPARSSMRMLPTCLRRLRSAGSPATLRAPIRGSTCW